VNDLFQNGPDDLGAACRVSAIDFHEGLPRVAGQLWALAE
jgi:hypothetical protein